MLPEAGLRNGWLDRLWSQPERRFQLVALFAALGLVVVVAAFGLSNSGSYDEEYWRSIGYPGVLFFSFLGSASVVLPIPGIVAVCGAGGLALNLVAVGLLAGLGETVGEFTGYAIGYGGRGVIEQRSYYQTVQTWMARRGTLVLFLMAAIPNPLFDVVGVAAGATRFSMTRFFVTLIIAKTLKGLAVAYACWQGVKLLPWMD